MDFLHFPRKIIMEGVVGGSHGDIAISNAVLSVNENCSFMPKEAQFSSNGSYLISNVWYIELINTFSHSTPFQV